MKTGTHTQVPVPMTMSRKPSSNCSKWIPQKVIRVTHRRSQEKTEHPSLVLVPFSSVFFYDQENRPARFGRRLTSAQVPNCLKKTSPMAALLPVAMTLAVAVAAAAMTAWSHKTSGVIRKKNREELRQFFPI